MINKILNFLQSRLVVLFVLFICFVLVLLFIFNLLFPYKITFEPQYLYLLYLLLFYLNLYLVLYIWKTKDFVLDSRYLFLIALNLLIFTPFYIVLKQQKIAEQLSIWTYYILFIGVIYEIILNILAGKLKKNEQ